MLNANMECSAQLRGEFSQDGYSITRTSVDGNIDTIVDMPFEAPLDLPTAEKMCMEHGESIAVANKWEWTGTL